MKIILGIDCAVERKRGVLALDLPPVGAEILEWWGIKVATTREPVREDTPKRPHPTPAAANHDITGKWSASVEKNGLRITQAVVARTRPPKEGGGSRRLDPPYKLGIPGDSSANRS